MEILPIRSLQWHTSWWSVNWIWFGVVLRELQNEPYVYNVRSTDAFWFAKVFEDDSSYWESLFTYRCGSIDGFPSNLETGFQSITEMEVVPWWALKWSWSACHWVQECSSGGLVGRLLVQFKSDRMKNGYVGIGTLKENNDKSWFHVRTFRRLRT